MGAVIEHLHHVGCLPLLLLFALIFLSCAQLNNPRQDFDQLRGREVSPGDGRPSAAPEAGAGTDTPLDQCIGIYRKASDSFGAHVVASDASANCIVLRTYLQCVLSIPQAELDHHDKLNSEGMMSVLRKKMADIDDCPEQGPVYEETTDEPRVCTYTGAPDLVYCSVFGDPHVLSFSSTLQTCVLRGTWPLVDNEHYTVLLTSSPLRASASNATFLSEVTVVIKASSECTGRQYALYLASASRSLPPTFNHGRAFLEPMNKVSMALTQGGTIAWILIPHVGTTIEIRQVGGWLSVNLQLPYEIARASAPGVGHASPVQLCHQGCPRDQLLDLRLFLAQRSPARHPSALLPMNRPSAVSLCRDADVTGVFLDACVFDLLSTGGVNRTQSASLAAADLRRNKPSAHVLMSQRRDVNVHDAWFHRQQALHSSGSAQRLSFVLLLITLLQAAERGALESSR